RRGTRGCSEYWGDDDIIRCPWWDSGARPRLLFRCVPPELRYPGKWHPHARESIRDLFRVVGHYPGTHDVALGGDLRRRADRSRMETAPPQITYSTQKVPALTSVESSRRSWCFWRRAGRSIGWPWHLRPFENQVIESRQGLLPPQT